MPGPTLDLVSGAPFWPIADGLPGVYPPLTEDQRCTVAVVGAGVTGALVAYMLAMEGIDVVVTDRRDVATGSTAASTALLSWELDVELAPLMERIGKASALRAYRDSLEAIETIAGLVETLPDRCGFARRASLYLASDKTDAERLEQEAELRSEHGLPSEYWNAGRLNEASCFRAPGAIRSEGSGEIDPYRFAHALLKAAVARGARVFDRTEIRKEKEHAGGITLESERGPVIEAERAVMALGYEIPRPLRHELVRLQSTYALVTEPTDPPAGWEDRCLVWESSRPYRYLRWTEDHRVMIGGEDEPFRNPVRRDRLLPSKVSRLGKGLSELLPDLPFEPAFGWTGTFGETADGLPFIGEWEKAPRRIFTLGYGANGNTFAVVAASIVRDLCLGKPRDAGNIYRLDR